MANEERNAWACFLGGLITLAVFGSHIWTKSIDGTYSGDDGLSLWAWDVIWLILGGIGIAIVVLIAFHLLYATITRVDSPDFVTDERDVMISRRGSQVTLVVISAGFLAALGLLAYGYSTLVALNTILIGMAVGATGSEVYRLSVYRFGF